MVGKIKHPDMRQLAGARRVPTYPGHLHVGSTRAEKLADALVNESLLMLWNLGPMAPSSALYDQLIVAAFRGSHGPGVAGSYRH